MSKARKTLNVADTVAMLNYRIQQTETADARRSLCLVIERILLDADRYRGFRCTNNVEVRHENNEVSFVSPDDSFRHYFCSDT